MPVTTATARPPRCLDTGICAPARGALLAELLRTHAAAAWIVVCDELRDTEQLAEDTEIFLNAMAGTARAAAGPRPEVLLFPESMPDSRDMREAFAASADRTAVLSRLRAIRHAHGAATSGLPDSGISKKAGAPAPPLLLFTTPAALLQPVPALEAFAASELTLVRGTTQPFQALLERLQAMDYDCEAVCEAPGHYAIRGGLIDIYPVNATQPYRLDFFGDDIEDIRPFDPVTQRSGESIESVTVAASPRLRLDPASTGLADYLAPATRLVLVEPATLDAAFSALAREATGHPSVSQANGGVPVSPLAAIVARCAALHGLADIDEAAALFDDMSESGRGGSPGSGDLSRTWDTESLVHHRRYPDDALVAQERLHFEDDARVDFLGQVLSWQEAGYAVRFVVTKEGEEQRAREILAEDAGLRKLKPVFLRGALNEGFRITFREEARLSWGGLPRSTRGLVLVTETELYGRRRARRASPPRRAIAQRSQIDQLLDFSELVEGDFVVHLQHGIALFRGLTKLETRDGVREVISLEFDDHVTLHVPLQESHLVSRYVGLSKVRPQLGRIGSGRWEKTRQAAERATIDMAAELLKIQAVREAEQGHAFPADTAWQREFEAAFPFTETPDQLRAITEAKADMERPRPMDRLICGDVGFGKTEVAIRAAFKAVQGGRQVAVLVPTTVLAQQHLNTFRERMAGYPIAIEMLSRFRSRAEHTQVITATAAGQVDILVGTHRLLQKDVIFRDLGLVIIDEEQRFGVKHKERFKTLRATVDVLSMSATPIPRTLYLALTGARDMSVIETAPTNRHPIQTIVKTYDEKIVVDAIRHEVRRGGQVFYLHNRVQTIDLVAARLHELMPDLRVGTGHGQMDEDDLEQVMTDFVAGKYHVLVCTTIIESGLDIPNCNTIIIEGADKFGLSQLYQLRGRVGRFKHQAYAYLLLHRHARLLEVARQRLNAMRTHNQLGAGFRIAMRDLELRGAGNLLGAQQSGHIVGVGFELYCQLLRQSVARLKGEKQAARVRASVKLDFVFVGEGAPAEPGNRESRYVDGYIALRDAEDARDALPPCPLIQARIPRAYLAEVRLRLDFYRKLALADSTATLKQLEADLKDRFGDFGDEVRALLMVTEVRLRAEQKGLSSVESDDAGRLRCVRASGKRDDFVMVGTRFPRLTAPEPLSRLREILAFLHNLPDPT